MAGRMHDETSKEEFGLFGPKYEDEKKFLPHLKRN
jgi:hypothetical protein